MIRFLLDSNLSHRVAQLLRNAGIDAAHVPDNDLQHATHSITLEFTRQHAVVLVSEDTDFGELLARQCTVVPSFVLLRTYEPMTPDEQAAVLLANLPEPASSTTPADAASNTRTAGAAAAACASRAAIKTSAPTRTPEAKDSQTIVVVSRKDQLQT